MNVPARFGVLISRRLATLHELDTVYGTEDVYNLLEIVAVDNANERELRKRNERK